MWKRQKHQTKNHDIVIPSSPTKYPLGTFVKTEKGYFYVQSTRRLKVSERVLWSWSPHRVVPSSEVALSHLKVGGRLKFRNGSLIQDVSNGVTYLIEEAKKRPIHSPDVYSLLGIKWDERYNSIMSVSKEEADMHELGDVLK